jgi:hypothetical protein
MFTCHYFARASCKRACRADARICASASRLVSASGDRPLAVACRRESRRGYAANTPLLALNTPLLRSENSVQRPVTGMRLRRAVADDGGLAVSISLHTPPGRGRDRWSDCGWDAIGRDGELTGRRRTTGKAQRNGDFRSSPGRTRTPNTSAPGARRRPTAACCVPKQDRR